MNDNFAIIGSYALICAAILFLGVLVGLLRHKDEIVKIVVPSSPMDQAPNASMKFRGQVKTKEDLPTYMDFGDMYYVQSTYELVLWNGEQWCPITTAKENENMNIVIGNLESVTTVFTFIGEGHLKDLRPLVDNICEGLRKSESYDFVSELAIGRKSTAAFHIDNLEDLEAGYDVAIRPMLWYGDLYLVGNVKSLNAKNLSIISVLVNERDEHMIIALEPKFLWDGNIGNAVNDKTNRIIQSNGEVVAIALWKDDAQCIKEEYMYTRCTVDVNQFMQSDI